MAEEIIQRVKLTLSYNGTSFFGFERQIGYTTVQGEIESAIEKATKAKVTITPSGRTDARVHALFQVCHFDLCNGFKIESLQGALNFYLPREIRVLEAVKAPLTFNARQAKNKTYCYDVYFSALDNPMLLDRAWRIETELDLVLLKEAMALFVGKHDFQNFRCVGSSAKTTTRNVFSFDISNHILYGESILRFSITADGFLYKMVRLIIGAVIRTAQGKLTIEELKSYIDNTATIKSKFTAPAYGLYLKNVEYL